MKKHISKKNTKKRRNYNKRKTGKKNCGCKSNIFLSMKKKLIGGNINPPSFQNFESTKDQYYYDVNTYNNDPNNPNLLVSTRTLPNFVGGKKNKTTRKIKLSRNLNIEKVVYLTKKNVEKTPEGEILDNLGLNNVCCRRHMLTHVDIE